MEKKIRLREMKKNIAKIIQLTVSRAYIKIHASWILSLELFPFLSSTFILGL